MGGMVLVAHAVIALSVSGTANRKDVSPWRMSQFGVLLVFS